MEKSGGIIESTDSGSGRERLGIRFTIDYLLFNKGGGGSGRQLEATAHDTGPGHRGTAGEPSPGTLPESLDLGGREKEAKGSQEEKEGTEEGEQGNTGSDNPQDKPDQSYIALISTAILASEDKKLLLGDIYQWIMDHYPYFKSKDKNWRNSVRHNLSLNECFVKAGRSDSGKGHFWAVHPANLRDFSRGDYRQRRARRRIRRAAGRIPYPAPPDYHPVPRLGGIPLWGVPPGRHLALPARMYLPLLPPSTPHPMLLVSRWPPSWCCL